MRDATGWSLSLGIWSGVRVRIHASLLLAAPLALYLGTRIEPGDDYTTYTLLAVGVLLVSLLWHELVHCAVAARVGGSVELIVLGPFGSFSRPHLPFDPRCELMTAVAGPLANFALCVAGTAVLLAHGDGMREIFRQPFYPTGLLEGDTWVVGVKLICWINWLLFLVNSIPAPPMDGGWALRSLLCMVMDYRSSARVVSRSGLLIALGLWILAALQRDTHDIRVVPIWLPLALLGMYLFFTSLQSAQRVERDELDDDLLSYDFAETYAGFDAPSTRQRGPGFLRRWWQHRRELREQRIRELEEQEDLIADNILMRVKQYGISGISREERALLQRVSARYRNRLRS